MKTFKQKKEDFEVLQDKISKSKITVFTSFAREGEKGLQVSQMRELKKELTQQESEYVVGKKTLIDKALHMRRVEGVNVFSMPGSMGVVFGYGDEVATAKSVYAFAKKNPAMKFFGALFGGTFIDEGRFTALAKLPAREVLIAQVLGMMQYPILGLVNVLQGSIRNLVVVLDQVSKKKAA